MSIYSVHLQSWFPFGSEFYIGDQMESPYKVDKRQRRKQKRILKHNYQFFKDGDKLSESIS